MKHFYSTLLLAVGIFIGLGIALEGRVKLGIDVLEDNQFKCLQGKRVGLLTHPAGVNRRGQSTIDVLHSAPEVNLVSLYGPEHGIYGDEKAERSVADSVDKKTGLPVYSLYGTHRRPSAEMLRGIDVMVIDLQDIGSRTYTYVSCMCYTMEECFKNRVEVIVLDRPNPLGGMKVDGPILDKNWMSYVGVFPVPYVHGLTIGELARIAKLEENWLTIPKEVRERGKLTVVPMKGWSRDMRWNDTGLKWIPTSPYVKTLTAAEGYPMTGLIGCGIGGFQNGCGTSFPFRFIASSKKNLSSVEKILRKRNIRGILLHRESSVNKSTGKSMEGLYVDITNFEKWRPTELSFHLMQLSCLMGSENPFAKADEATIRLLNIHVGTDTWYKALAKMGDKLNVDMFLSKWEMDAKNFQEWSRDYWIY